MNSYQIPQQNISDLQTKIDKLNKRALKLQLPPIVLTVVSSELKPIKWDFDPNTGRCDVPIKFIQMNNITVDGLTPTLNGWTMIARLECTPNGNMVKKLVDEELSEEYRTRNTCDHCNTNRYRKDTYLLRNEQQEVKQIGRNCLADYLRSEDYADILAARAELIRTFEDMGGDDDDFSSWGSYESHYDVLHILQLAASAIRCHGWVSRKSARAEDSTQGATADHVIGHFHECTKDSAACRDKVCKLIIEDADKLTAEAALAWIAAQNSGTDYIYNLQLAVKNAADQAGIKSSEIALISSAVYCYERSMQIEREKKLKPVSEHVGAVGDKLIGLELRLTKVSTWEVNYGNSYRTAQLMARYSFTDMATGTAYIWKTEVRDLVVDADYQVSGTIKAHDEYKGFKSTVLTRCKLADPGTPIKTAKVKRVKTA